MKSPKALSGLALLCLLTSAQAVTYFDDGGVHVTAGTFPMVVVVENSGNSPAGAPTTLTIQPGAQLNGDSADNSLVVGMSSNLTVNGGTITQDLFVDTSGNVTINGGTFQDDIYVTDFNFGSTPNFIMNGGTVEDDFQVEGPNSVATIQGGTFFYDMQSEFDAQLIIWGGLLGQGPNPGGFDQGFGTFNGGTITIHGSGFTVDGVYQAASGPISSLGGTSIAGWLSDGTPFDLPYFRDRDSALESFGDIVLVHVPEPHTTSLLMLALGSVGLRRRR